VKRSTFVRVVPPPIELVDWERVEGKGEDRPKNGNGGEQRTLFD
jgi:hypothetical protein